MTTQGTLRNASRRDALEGVVADYLINIPVGMRGQKVAKGAKGQSRKGKIPERTGIKRLGCIEQPTAKTNPVDR